MSPDPALVGSRCDVTLNLVTDVDLPDGAFRQLNSGGVSTGSGVVYLFAEGGDGRLVIAQENHASGAGCEQDNFNVLVLATPTSCCTTYFPFCIVTYTATSTCGFENTYKVSTGTYFGHF